MHVFTEAMAQEGKSFCHVLQCKAEEDIMVGECEELQKGHWEAYELPRHRLFCQAITHQQ